MAFALRASALFRIASHAPVISRTPVMFTSTRFMSTYPTDRRYKKSHEWVKVEGDVATVGITDHAQAALGDIVFADLPEIGQETVAGEPAATVESVKTAADIYAPFDGEIVGINEGLEGSPDLINQEPHENGWMFRVKASDTSKYDEMMKADEYEKSLEDSE